VLRSAGPPQYIADELLRAEGFTDIQYLDVTPAAVTQVAVGRREVAFR
jgi:hypothetical protein